MQSLFEQKPGVIPKQKQRIWEIDFLRGLCLLIMVFYHTIYDLNSIFGLDAGFDTQADYIIGRITAVTFVILCGISCSFSRNNFKRGLKILIVGIIITIVTTLYDPGMHIWFGILHMLGTSIMLYVPLQKKKPIYAIAAGLAILIAGYAIRSIQIEGHWLMILGIPGKGFRSEDYYPLIPWTGVLFLGTAAGRIFYTSKKSILKIVPPDNILNLAGRHSLSVYVAHQPLILGVLFLLRAVGIF